MERLVELAKSINLEENYGLMDILEFHNMLKFFTSKNYPEVLSEQQVKDTKSKICQIVPLFLIMKLKKILLMILNICLIQKYRNFRENR